jgi:hypothetical protein
VACDVVQLCCLRRRGARAVLLLTAAMQGSGVEPICGCCYLLILEKTTARSCDEGWMQWCRDAASLLEGSMGTTAAHGSQGKEFWRKGVEF